MFGYLESLNKNKVKWHTIHRKLMVYAGNMLASDTFFFPLLTNIGVSGSAPFLKASGSLMDK